MQLHPLHLSNRDPLTVSTYIHVTHSHFHKMSNSNQIKNIKEILMFCGFLYTSKLTFRTVSRLYQGFKTFILPRFWKRNFRKEYGSWAGITFIFLFLILASLLTFSQEQGQCNLHPFTSLTSTCYSFVVSTNKISTKSKCRPSQEQYFLFTKKKLDQTQQPRYDKNM